MLIKKQFKVKQKSLKHFLYEISRYSEEER